MKYKEEVFRLKKIIEELKNPQEKVLVTLEGSSNGRSIRFKGYIDFSTAGAVLDIAARRGFDKAKESK